jgi:hypothetical protein
LIDALGGPTAVARMVGLKHGASIQKWRDGSEPIPQEYARFLHDRCVEILGELQTESWRLKREEIPQAEHRHEQRVRAARERFFERFGRMPTDQPIRQRPRLQGAEVVMSPRAEIIQAVEALADSPEWQGSPAKVRPMLVERYLNKPVGWCRPWTFRPDGRDAADTAGQ